MNVTGWSRGPRHTGRASRQRRTAKITHSRRSQHAAARPQARVIAKKGFFLISAHFARKDSRLPPGRLYG